MSGIAGIIHFDGAPIEPGQVEKMTAAMVHRGPDGIHHWVRGSVALGQCMLRTTPESLEETQPLTNEDASLVLVMDGRVDNWEELRRELLGRGAVLRTRADAELVLRAYEIWGRECLSHIDGDFALVIWDAQNRTAFCARDRMGNKPFHYHWDGKTLAFASELHAILALPWVREEPNEGMLSEMLADTWYSRDETVWKGVMRLVAAHWLQADANGLRIERYWQPDLWATLPYTRDEEYVEHYRALLKDVVRRMSRSQKPVAFEVSGGLDSSALFAMAEHLRRQNELPAPAIQGYALDFHGDPDADELVYSRAVSRHLGIPVHEIPPSVIPISWYRDRARLYHEFPGYPNGIMAIGLRETARREGCQVILSGVGGDEWLGITNPGAYYAEELAAGRLGQVYACLKDECRQSGIPKALWRLGRHGVAPLLPQPIKAVLRKPHGINERTAWLSDKFQNLHQSRRNQFHVPVTAQLKRRGQSEQIRILEGAFDVFARESEERMCSSLQLDLRKPFFNAAIVQFAFSTTDRLRSRGYVNKWLHRQAMDGLLPDEVLKRTCKASFAITFEKNLEEVKAELMNDIALRRGEWVRTERARALCENRLDNPCSGWSEWILWALVGCDALIIASESSK